MERILSYQHLTGRDFCPPTSSRIFFEPADTEVGVWVASDLITPGCTVIDLGSGSGAAAAAMARAGAIRVHGLDTEPNSVEWAKKHYGGRIGERIVTFAQGDFSTLSTADLLATASVDLLDPLVITSNPPYVPLAQDADPLRWSIGGGVDGLKWAPTIIQHAVHANADLGLTIGSYSSPRHAARLLEAAGYRIGHITLCPLPLGEFTRQNFTQVSDLEQRGEAILWQYDGQIAYFIVGLACHRVGTYSTAAPLTNRTEDGLLSLLRTAARSHKPILEAFDESDDGTWPAPVRVLVLPKATARHHW